MADETIIYDVETEDITNAVCELVNRFPLLDGDYISFSNLPEDEGITLFPMNSAIIVKERESITGDVYQLCQYPFNIFYRAAGLNEKNKISVKERLDNLGRWLERQTITDGEHTYRLDEYPSLAGRKIKKIERQTPAYLEAVSQNGIEDWAISISVQYENNFVRS